MKYFIILSLFTAVAMARDLQKESTNTKKAKTEVQKMEETGIINTFPIGPYSKDGNYQFFDRAAIEAREAQEEKQETEGD